MKVIQHINGIVVDIINVREDATAENIAIINNIPPFEHREGYNGVLKYNEDGVYWDYEEVVISNEISAEEFQGMIEEVM